MQKRRSKGMLGMALSPLSQHGLARLQRLAPAAQGLLNVHWRERVGEGASVRALVFKRRPREDPRSLPRILPEALLANVVEFSS